MTRLRFLLVLLLCGMGTAGCTLTITSEPSTTVEGEQP